MITKKLFSAALAVLAMLSLTCAHAGTITDGAADPNAYWGSNDHGLGDSIGGSAYDINGVTITRVGSVLTVTVATNFAGHAGVGSSFETGNTTTSAGGLYGVAGGTKYLNANYGTGIGYGDVFLANTWNPAGTDAHHTTDNAANGTDWAYGLSLDNRWSNTGGTFKLYALPGANSANIITSNSFITCGSGCTYRDGQADAVNRSTATDTGISGSWTVTADQQLQFTLNTLPSDMMSFASFAVHWGETCQNDVVEGLTRVVPTPGSVSLVALGLCAMLVLRRRAVKGGLPLARSAFAGA